MLVRKCIRQVCFRSGLLLHWLGGRGQVAACWFHHRAKGARKGILRGTQELRRMLSLSKQRCVPSDGADKAPGPCYHRCR